MVVTLTGSMAFNGSTSTTVENVGTYTMAQGGLTMSSANDNYVMSFSNPTPNKYVITPATLIVTPISISTPFNGVPLSNMTWYSDNTANYTINGFASGQSVSSAVVTLSGSMALQQLDSDSGGERRELSADARQSGAEQREQ